MTVTIDKKYLVFPVNTEMKNKRLKFFDGEKLIYALDIKLDVQKHDFEAYIEMTPFIGKTLTLAGIPDEEIIYRKADTTDEIPGLYKEPHRPLLHFTAKHGWINDPNGLVYHDGIYHLFFQYNPADPFWGNMHWGHAVSRDLIHWEEKDIALYPDNLGEMFSGSAIVDKKNILGLSKNGNDTLLLFYTACGRRNLAYDGKLQSSQCLAVSTDNFKTIVKYDGNPIVPPIAPYNRDPKVVFCEELDSYIMALYTEENGKGDYSLLESRDLINWKRIYDYRIEGEWEFPDIMKFKGNDGKTKYVMTSNTDCYIVHEVRDGKFVRIQEPRKVFYCSTNHAPLSFDNIPDGRCIRAIWETFDIPFVSEGFCGQILMLEYTFEEKNGIYYLAAKPTQELTDALSETLSEESLNITSLPYTFKMSSEACLTELCGKIDTESILTVTIFGLKIKIDFKSNRIIFSDEKYCPITVIGDMLKVKILVDKCGIEVFSDDGKSCFYAVAGNAFPNYENMMLEIAAENSEYVLDKLAVKELI